MPAQAPSAPPPSEPVLNLSRFEVTTTQDKGYVANNAASGLKTNQELLKIPQSVTIITRDLIDDVGAINTSDLLQFAGASQFFRGESVRLRGARTLNPYLDDAIDNVPYSDNVNIDSYEIIRGPAGVLYANAGMAGVVLKTSKKPLPFNQDSVKLSVNDWGLYRTEIDSTGPLGDLGDAKVGYRFVAAHQDGSAYFRHLEDERLAVHPTFQVDLKNTTLRVALDYIDRTTSPNTVNFVLPDGRIYVGAGRREGYFAPGGMESHKQIRQRVALLHRFSPNWESKLNLSHVGYTRKGSVLLPNTLNWATEQVGFRSRRNYQKNNNWILTHDFLGNYAVGPVQNQSAFGYTLTDEIARVALTNSTTFGFPVVSVSNPMMDSLVLQPYDSYVPVSSTGSWTNNRRSTYYYQHQAEIWPERLIAVAGLSYAALQTVDVPNVSQRNSAGGTRNISFEETLHRYGLVFNLTREVAFYALHSTTFAPQSNSNTRDINGTLLPAQNGLGREIGVKTALFGGKLSTTLSFFEMELTNVGILAATPSPVTGQSYFIPIGQQIQKGWDATIAYAPVPQWQILLNAYDGTVKDQNGATVDNTYRSLFSFFTRYEFKDGALKGVTIGGGGSKTNGNIFTIISGYTGFDGTAPSSITLESVWNVSAFAAYRLNQHWDFRLNVENALDKAFALGAQHPRLVDPSPPRTFRLTATYNF